jgi:hypothetical protein
MKLSPKQIPAELRLDLTVASQMRPHADLAARLKLFGLRPAMLKASVRYATEAGVINQLRIPWRVIVDYFGEPVTHGSDYLVYQLVLWPSHQFHFEIHEQGWVSHNGFRLITPDPIQIKQPKSLDEAKKVLTPGYHTALEIKDGLHAPRLVQGWERMEDWYYTLPMSRHHLALEFDFGLLTGVDERDPIMM